jgi:D-arabinose 1-dehydrogenase-like Zn-dependent alcohol dehydrogenase
MPKMRVAQVSRAKGALELVEREIPVPATGTVRVRVHACGICHSDTVTKDGLVPDIQYPRVPGHEVIGEIDAVGPGVVGWSPGQRVGVGWFGGNDGTCDACRRGQLWACQMHAVTGVTFDGGYAEYMIAPTSALARVPDELSAIEAAPLMCAGITTFNGLRNSGARAGDVVAVLGIGGLGHLGIQFAARMGHRTVAIARGKDKEPLARKLGAHHYIDSKEQDPAAELLKLGGASAILGTVTSGEAMTQVIGGLAADGTLMVIGGGGVIQAPPYLLITGRRSLQGWYSGTSIDSQDTLAFSVLHGVRSMNEVFPMERIAEAYERMLSGDARFRIVVKVSG